jgi:transposase
MNNDAAQLPDNINELRKLFISTCQQHESEINLLKEQIRILQHKLFGKKSEKLSGKVGIGQLLLFNEAEQVENQEVTSEKEQIEVPAHTRKRGRRKPLPNNLPHIDVIHDLTEEEKQCACGKKKICWAGRYPSSLIMCLRRYG